LLTWTEANSSPDKQHWVAFKFVWGGFVVVCNKLENDFIGETRAWVWRHWLWTWGAQPAWLYFFWTVPQLFS